MLAAMLIFVGASVWALPPLGEIDVALDIKPESCPNPLMVGSHGIMPVAILGTLDLDVTTLDPATLKIGYAGAEVVTPLRWSYEDVATPFEPFLGKASCDDCTYDGPDGFLDLTVKFKALEVVTALETALGSLGDRDCIPIRLIGEFKEEFGGEPIEGQDVVVILMQ
jgi:hypothetical protein